MMAIGNRINGMRKEIGMTQQDLADKVGMNRSSIVKIENSQRAVSLDEGVLFSRVLGVSLDTLLHETSLEATNNSFVKAFKSKGMADVFINDVEKCELLFDALFTQSLIFGEE